MVVKKTTSEDSTVEQVLNYIRERIIEGQFLPPSKLFPKQIAASCGASFIPVREAADAEHRKIISKLRRRDRNGAVEALQGHLKTTVDLLRKALQVTDFSSAPGIPTPHSFET